MALRSYLHKKQPKKYKRNKFEEQFEQPQKERKPKTAKKPRRKKRDPFYDSYAWKKVRLEILERDNYTCAICGKTNKDYNDDGITKVKLTIDHIIRRVDDPSKELDHNNLRILCSICHEGLSGIQNEEESYIKLEDDFYIIDEYDHDKLIGEIFGVE